nr:YhjD/YihY/BrkB family envelope integrity protein [Actinomadura madurae]
MGRRAHLLLHPVDLPGDPGGGVAGGPGGQSATDDLIDSVGDLAPGSVRDLLISSIRQLEGSSGGAGVVAVLSLGAAVWSASGYVGAFMRASNVVYDVPEGRRSGRPCRSGSASRC